MEAKLEIHPKLVEALEPGEQVMVTAFAREAILAVTDRRVLVAEEERLALAVAIEGVRRIQFDLEHRRPATLVIVPEEPRDEPQVLSIPPDQYESACEALVMIGLVLADTRPRLTIGAEGGG